MERISRASVAIASCNESSRAAQRSASGAAAEATIENRITICNVPRTKFLLADTGIKADDNTFVFTGLGAREQLAGTGSWFLGMVSARENFLPASSSM